MSDELPRHAPEFSLIPTLGEAIRGIDALRETVSRIEGKLEGLPVRVAALETRAERTDERFTWANRIALGLTILVVSTLLTAAIRYNFPWAPPAQAAPAAPASSHVTNTVTEVQPTPSPAAARPVHHTERTILLAQVVPAPARSEPAPPKCPVAMVPLLGACA